MEGSTRPSNLERLPHYPRSGKGGQSVEVLGTAFSSNADSVQPPTLEERITRITGTTTVDCGTFSMVHNGVALPIRASAKATNKPDSMRESLACAEQALRERKGFKIAQHGFTFDTERFSGVLGTADGVTLWFEFSTWPCRGPHCDASPFTTQPCRLSDVRIEPAERTHVFRCVAPQGR